MRGAAGLVRVRDSLRYGRMAMCERLFRVRNHLVGRDASYEEALCERNRFGERRFV